MAIVVSDTSPIVALAFLGHLRFLEILFDRVLIPPAVASELRGGSWGAVAEDALRCSFIEVRGPADAERVRAFSAVLDLGEPQALALAVETQADAVLIDEAAGRRIARQLGLRLIGVLGVLAQAKNRGLIGTIAPEIDRLRQELGFFVSDALRADVLREAGE